MNELEKALQDAINSMKTTVQAFTKVIELYKRERTGENQIEDGFGNIIRKIPEDEDDRYRPGMIWQMKHNINHRVCMTYTPEVAREWAYFTHEDGSGPLQYMMRKAFEERYSWLRDSTLE